jgi:hypothetical protein
MNNKKIVAESIIDLLKPKDPKDIIISYNEIRNILNSIQYHRTPNINNRFKNDTVYTFIKNNPQQWVQQDANKIQKAINLIELCRFISINKWDKPAANNELKNLVSKVPVPYTLLRMLCTLSNYEEHPLFIFIKNNPQYWNQKDIEKISNVVNLSATGSRKSYPAGYKIYRILKYVNENVVSTRQQIVKLIFELNYGPNTFNPNKHSSYWPANFPSQVYPYIGKDENNVFKLNNAGLQKLQTLEQKFKNIKVNPLV